MFYKKLISFCISFILLFVLTLNTFATQSGVYSWYCIRNKEHKQPPLPTELGFIEYYGGYYIDKTHNDSSEEKVIYLTFDAGYENGNIEKILEILKAENTVGAFFILGNLISKNTELVKRMVDEGHTVCNHTLSHKDMTKIDNIDVFREELSSLEELYYQRTGHYMSKYFRFPEGKFNELSMKYANELGYKTIFWSFAYADWDNGKQMSPEAAKKKIMDNIHNGSVILLHPTSATNAQILGDVIRELKSAGYRFGTLDELTA